MTDALPEAPERWRCEECRHVSETYLTAPSPFDAHDLLIACEKCKEVGSLVAACWKCSRAAGIGTPHSGVYRYIQSCSEHNPERVTPEEVAMPEITRRSFMALLAAAGVAVRSPVEALPEAPAPTPPPPEPAQAPSKAKFTWTPDGGKPIPLQVSSVSQSVHTETIMDDDHYGMLRRQALRSGEIEVETSNFWDCGDMRQRGTLRFTVGGQEVNVKADVWGCERELGPYGHRQRTTLSYQEFTVDEA